MSSTAPPSVLPDISPTSGEIGCHDSFRQSATLMEWTRSAKLPISLLVGEMSGRTEGGAVERDCNRPSGEFAGRRLFWTR
ncbi:MAG: hypothetical protein EOQ86_18160 [Mesorhizobium sp.]|nr:MAG: hypothetical protein EOQ85_16510 [Mesorhizobium sp.]RWH81003.1 MAG: hypothetical protein EOQ86_18160 [Mesorhizobium sp.]RWH90619.1 MAG: hypothetical protein EOQ87_13660 [Mesorhizobium sp.]RWH97464.1 MAG: hypothetical protein EOQ88_17605 [Mesorhizobium sp.]RWI01143.1 MAG: hypothetical protein EOQ89_17500 [Mesorhizobium sp.]